MNPTDFYLKLAENKAALLEIVQQFAQTSLMVIGDIALDEFVTGETERISREAPVVIVRHEQTKQVLGGGGNTMANLATLGAKVLAVGRIGKDYYGQAVLQCLEEKEIAIEGIFSLPHFTTTAKTRIAAHARQSVTQQIVRIDRKEKQPFVAPDAAEMAAFISTNRPKVKAIVCADYGEGVLEKTVLEAALQHELVIVDAQKDLFRYKGATIFTPNLPEAEQAVGYFIADEKTLFQAGNDLLQLTEAKYILITQGEKGMTLFEKGENEVIMSHIPAFNQRQVFDVTGAGDTVTAVLALALSLNATAWQAAVLGNLAASVVVQTFGTATITQEELRENLTRMNYVTLLDNYT